LKDKKEIIGVIPVRYGSSRFPGKPLADICGKPMIQRVYERSCQASMLSTVLVATDDVRIFKIVESFGGEAVMTPKAIPSGTDRVAFVAKGHNADIVVNIQGDEPFIEPKEIDSVAQILLDDESAMMGTLVKRITRIEELTSPNTAKVIIDQNGYALYFSRSPIPNYRDNADYSEWIQNHTYYKHVGIYSYRKSFLMDYSRWEPTPLEMIEKLEQLRALERGFKIKVAETSAEPVCVDTPKDLERVRQMICEELGSNKM
jgi:3-deoxy-manno-octulosonate cytidylyltransferase (CMP-KDO synthetase)